VKKILATIVGPTAVGKTKASIQVAEYFHTEIISADARQFYHEMSIGTAKPGANVLSRITHHFIGHLSVQDEYSAGNFEKDTISLLDELFKIHSVVVMTGGSGLFVKSVLDGFDTFPEVKESVESQLQATYESEGIGVLQKLLKEYDPEYYSTVDTNNPRRLLRALAICVSSGKPYSQFRNANPISRDFIPVVMALNEDRDILYKRIDDRVDDMIGKGLLEEVKGLKPYQHLNALQTVGYSELFDYLDGKISLEEAIRLIKQHSRNYAKRQMTWFGKMRDIHWFKPDEVKEMIALVELKLKE